MKYQKESTEGLTFLKEWVHDKKKWQRWLMIIITPFFVNSLLGIFLERILGTGIAYEAVYFFLAPTVFLTILHDVAPSNNVKLTRFFATSSMIFGIIFIAIVIVVAMIDISSFEFKSLITFIDMLFIGILFRKIVPKVPIIQES